MSRSPCQKFKYVDDGMIVSKVTMDNIPGSGRRDKHDLPTQNMFRRVVCKAESRDMKVNKDKTKMLCVSDAVTYIAGAFIVDDEGCVVSSGGSLKVGMTMP